MFDGKPEWQQERFQYIQLYNPAATSANYVPV